LSIKSSIHSHHDVSCLYSPSVRGITTSHMHTETPGVFEGSIIDCQETSIGDPTQLLRAFLGMVVRDGLGWR
jgi:hypothetical protein